MPVNYSRFHQPYFRFFISLIVCLLVLVVGFYAISWQTAEGFNHEARQRLMLAQRQVNLTLDNGKRAASNVLAYVGDKCDDALVQKLRQQVAVVPNVRTVNLAIGDNIYCTSLFGARNSSLDLTDFSQGQLDLMSGNPVTPGHALIAYRLFKGEKSVVVGIDSYFLQNILDLLGTHTRLYLKIGSSWLDDKGEVSEGDITIPGLKVDSINTPYAYQISTFIAPHAHWRFILEYSLVSVIIFPFLGVLAGITTWLLLGRMGSPLAQMKSALLNHQFIPYLQPLVEGENYAVIGAEALMRWQHPKVGMIPPDQFIPLAEQSGLIVPMTQMMMKQVSDYFAPKAKQLPEGFHFSFNISASHCTDMGLLEDCRTFLTAFAEYPVLLVLELTERELICPNEITTRLFRELHKLGVLLAIDDFGTGHSSLSYVQQFEIDVLKIDQSFIAKIGTDALSAHIVDNVIDLAKRLNLNIVAEGIETRKQAEYLRTFQLDYLQGYLFGRPQPMSEFAKQWLNPIIPAATPHSRKPLA